MNKIEGTLYRVNGKNNETKRSAAGEVIVTESVQKAMSSGGSEATEVMAQSLVIGTYTITTVVR